MYTTTVDPFIHFHWREGTWNNFITFIHYHARNISFLTNTISKFYTYFLDTKALWEQGQSFRGRQGFWLKKNVNAEIRLSLKGLNSNKQLYWQSVKTNLARTVPVESIVRVWCELADDCWLSWNWPELAGNAPYITPAPRRSSLRSHLRDCVIVSASTRNQRESSLCCAMVLNIGMVL